MIKDVAETARGAVGSGDWEGVPIALVVAFVGAATISGSNPVATSRTRPSVDSASEGAAVAGDVAADPTAEPFIRSRFRGLSAAGDMIGDNVFVVVFFKSGCFSFPRTS